MSDPRANGDPSREISIEIDIDALSEFSEDPGRDGDEEEDEGGSRGRHPTSR